MSSHFFQIIHDYIVKDRRLGLPKQFVTRFGEQLGKAGLIEDPMGKIWPVELKKAKGEIYFHTGWQEFMEYYSISVGHFLIFRHEGDSHFHVSICDMTACEIDYPCHREDVDESDPEEVSLERTPDETDHSMEDMDVPFQCATRSAHTKANRNGPTCGANPTSHEPKKRSYVKCQEPNSRHCAASKRRFEDDKKARCSNVPSGFAVDFLTKRGDNVLTLKDSTGKQWYVGYKVSSENKASLYRGWYEFAVLENHLKVDDACVFELVDIDNLAMKVNIIRASPDVV
ncbi:hypothetical protein MKW94_003142 [Papaver nudicaule]|uniref:TF-B3 domain-containing protein n=1 Tax=Papaver nudicaule TaxID=74823 RepID=A0AA41SKC5_PAPNU|nr:hypothetical protein [Papaver nudicaule]